MDPLRLRVFCCLCLVLAVTSSSANEHDASHDASHAASHALLSRSKRSTSCAAKFKLVSGHTACLEGSEKSVLTEAEKIEVVDKHNEFRAAASPAASNMMKLSWDDELGMLAQKWADQCKQLTHDQQRHIPGRFMVGQNIALGTSSWSSSVTLWHSETQYFTYNDTNYDFYKVGHYTQVMWGDTTLVGCGRNTCGGYNHYICDYGPTGNWLDRVHLPYTAGEPCSACPDYCVDSALCDCGLTCVNGRPLNLTTCTCSCLLPPPLYLAPDCELNCTGTSDEGWCEDQGKCPSQQAWCPHKCKLCPYVGAGYTGPVPDGGQGLAARHTLSMGAFVGILFHSFFV